jgi:hypothetical protein
MAWVSHSIQPGLAQKQNLAEKSEKICISGMNEAFVENNITFEIRNKK